MAEPVLVQIKVSVWKQGLCWLVLLGPLFFFSYGQVHQFTSTCALGLSRSATIVAAWLLSEGHAESVSHAVALIKSQRPQVVLTSAHLQILESFSKELQYQTSQ